MEAKAIVVHSGVAVEFGDKKLIVPPLTSKQVKSFVPKLMEHDAIVVQTYADIYKRMELRREFVKAALQRNYPDIDDDTMEDFVTTDNVNQLLRIVLGMDDSAPKVKTTGEN